MTALAVAIVLAVGGALLYRSLNDPIGSSQRVVIQASSDCGRFSFTAQGHRWTNDQIPGKGWSSPVSGTFTRTGRDDATFKDDAGYEVHLHSERKFDTLDCFVN